MSNQWVNSNIIIHDDVYQNNNTTAFVKHTPEVDDPGEEIPNICEDIVDDKVILKQFQKVKSGPDEIPPDFDKIQYVFTWQ